MGRQATLEKYKDTYSALAEVPGQQTKYLSVGESAERLKSSRFDSCPQNQLFSTETINIVLCMTQRR